jgi:hypothetical protein
MRQRERERGEEKETKREKGKAYAIEKKCERDGERNIHTGEEGR